MAKRTLGSRIWISIRRALSLLQGSYTDRNDGFLRSALSRSKNRHSQNTKQGKVSRIKPPWKR